jgi:hypothetical protein
VVEKYSCIAYRGSEFTVEWYFNEKERSQAFEYYLTLTAVERRKVLMLFKRMGDFGKISVTNAFQKKSDKLPPNEKNRAMDCRIDYLSRTKKGTYYGKR